MHFDDWSTGERRILFRLSLSEIRVFDLNPVIHEGDVKLTSLLFSLLFPSCPSRSPLDFFSLSAALVVVHISDAMSVSRYSNLMHSILKCHSVLHYTRSQFPGQDNMDYSSPFGQLWKQGGQRVKI